MYFFYYIPTGVDAGSRRFPFMTVALTAVCALVFLLNKYFYFVVPFDFNNYVYYPGYTGLPTALTSAFLHYGYVHLLSNLVYLVLFGWYLEDRLGPACFSVVFLGAAFVGNVLQGLFNIHALDLDGMGIVGASGAVSGVMGAFMIRLYMSRIRIAYWIFMPLQGYTRGGKVEVPVIFALALWVILQVSRGLIQFEGAAANVAHVTHLAGFVFGAAFTAAIGGLRKGRVEGHLMRARRYLRKAEFYGAQDELSRYVEYRPEDGAAHAELARVLVQTGDRAGAKKHYREACERLLDGPRRSEAEAVFQEALRGFPDFTLSEDAHLKLAFGLERTLKFDAALRAYENFQLRYPQHPEASFTLLRSANLLWRSFERRDDARERYEKLVAHYPEDEWVDFALEQIRILTA